MIPIARRMQGAAPSAVREILKVAERPDVLSFAGGLPAPELFPAAEISEAYARVLLEQPGAALQYGVTEGSLPLRAWLTDQLRGRHIPTSAEQLLIVNGSQQGIDLVARVLLNPGDTVLVENPTYLAALQAFSAFEVNVVPVESDDQGLKLESLEAALLRSKPKLLYLVPDFQNPKGTTLSHERRVGLAELVVRHQLPVLEDDPYGALRFRGAASVPLAALAPELVVYLGTFSKTLAPGLRIGWVHAPLALMRPLTVAKQACDLQTATLAQRATVELLKTFDYLAHLGRLRGVYGERCEAMLEALTRFMPAGARWSRPDGGLFVWLQLPPGARDAEVFQAALANKVAVVPGSGFFVGPGEQRFVRLNFSNQPVEKIRVGMELLAGSIASLLHVPPAAVPREMELRH